MFRTALARQARLFSTTPIARKSPVETVKDAAKVVDRTISDAAVKGIETGGRSSIPLSSIPPSKTPIHNPSCNNLLKARSNYIHCQVLNANKHQRP